MHNTVKQSLNQRHVICLLLLLLLAMQNQSGGTRIRWFGSTWIPPDTKSLDASWYDQIQHLRIRSRCENSRSSAQQFVRQTKTLWSDYLNFSESLRPAVVFKVSSVARIWFQFIFVFLVFFFIILHSSSIDISLYNLAVPLPPTQWRPFIHWILVKSYRMFCIS